MNCLCQPGQVAVKRISNKKNENFGKEFYTCPTQTCRFFCWADAKVPPILHQRIPPPPQPSSSSSTVVGSRPPFYNHSASSSTGPLKSNNYNGSTNNHNNSINPLNPLNLPCAKFNILSFQGNTAFIGLICPFHPAINTFMMKHADTCLFDHSRKMWTFDIKIYDQILPLLRENGFFPEEVPRFLIDGLKKYLLKMFKPSGAIVSKVSGNSIGGISSSSMEGNVDAGKEIQTENSMEVSNKADLLAKLNISPSLAATLLPFQVEGVHFIINHGGRGLIGDDMGCGKTVQAIALLQHYRNHWPALIIVPTNLVHQWKEELLKFCEDDLQPKDICSVKTGKDPLHGKIAIIPYSLIDKYIDRQEILSERFGICIADESHKLKNSETRTAQSVVPLLKAIPIAICLTGTPMLNRPAELFTQLNALLPTVFTDQYAFFNRYCDGKKDSFGYFDSKGSSNEAELKLLLEHMVMIRRLKDQVIQELPQKNREKLYVEADPAYAAELTRIQKLSDLLEAKLKDPTIDQEEKKKLHNQKEQLLLEHYRVTGLSKILSIKREVLQLIDSARIQRAMAQSAEDAFTGQEIHSNLVVESKQKENDEDDGDKNFDVFEDQPFPTESTREGRDSKLKRNNMKKEVSGEICSDEDILVDTESEKENEESAAEQNESDEDTEELYDYSDDDTYEDEGSDDDHDDDEVEEIDFDDADVYFTTEKKSSRSRSSRQNSRKHHFAKKKKQKTKHESSSSVCVDLTDDATLPLPITTEKRKVKSLFFSPKSTKKEKHQEDKPKKVGLSNKILVFAHHKAVLDAIESVLRDSEVQYIRVDGSTSKNRKSSLISQFQNDEATDIALLSITACGTGLNLTRANIALFAELYWSPGINNQAEDRIHRIGQKADHVRIIYILARNTADDIIWGQIERKSSTIRATIGNGDRSRNLSSNGGNSKQKKQQQTLEKFVGSSQNSVSSMVNIGEWNPIDDSTTNKAYSTLSMTAPDIASNCFVPVPNAPLPETFSYEPWPTTVAGPTSTTSAALLHQKSTGGPVICVQPERVPTISNGMHQEVYGALPFNNFSSLPQMQSVPPKAPEIYQANKVTGIETGNWKQHYQGQSAAQSTINLIQSAPIHVHKTSSDLTNDALARAEKNRQEAQKRLALTRQREQQQSQHLLTTQMNPVQQTQPQSVYSAPSLLVSGRSAQPIAFSNSVHRR